MLIPPFLVYIIKLLYHTHQAHSMTVIGVILTHLCKKQKEVRNGTPDEQECICSTTPLLYKQKRLMASQA